MGTITIDRQLEQFQDLAMIPKEEESRLPPKGKGMAGLLARMKGIRPGITD